MLCPNRCSGYISAFKNILLPASCLLQPNVVVGAGAQPVGPNTLSKALCSTLLFFTLSPAKRTKLHGQAFPLLVGFCFPLVTPCSFIWSRSAVAIFFPHSLGLISKALSTSHQRAAVVSLCAQYSAVGRCDTCNRPHSLA